MSDLTTFSEDSNAYLNVPQNLVYVNKTIAKELRVAGSSDFSINVLSLAMVQASIHLKQGAFREAINAILDSFKFITEDDIETAFESYQYLWQGLSPIMDFIKNCDDGCLFDTISVDVIGLIEPFLAIREYLGCALVLDDASDVGYCTLPYSSGDSGQLYDPDFVYTANLMCSADSDVSEIDADILQSLSDSTLSEYTTLSDSLGDQDYSVLATYYASTALSDLISDDLDSSILNMQSAIASACLIAADSDNFYSVDEIIYDAFTEIYFAFADLDDYSNELDAYTSLAVNFNFYLYQYALKVNDNTLDWTTVSDLQSLISTSLEDADTSKTVILNGLTSCLDSLADDDFTTALSYYEGTISDIASLSGVDELYDFMTKTFVMLLISLLPYDSGSDAETNLGDLIDAYNGYVADLYAMEENEDETSARALSTESDYDADLVAETLTAVNEYLSSQFSESSRSLGTAADYIIDSYNEVRAQYEDSFAMRLLTKSVSLFQSSLTDRALRYFATALKSASDTSKLKSPFYSAAMTAASVVVEGANEVSNAMEYCDLISDAVDELIDLMDEYSESDSSSETDDDDDDDEEKTVTCDGCYDDSTTYITFTDDDQLFDLHREDSFSCEGYGMTDADRTLTTTPDPATVDTVSFDEACSTDISSVTIPSIRTALQASYSSISSGTYISWEFMRIFDLFFSVMDAMELSNYELAMNTLMDAMNYISIVSYESDALREAIKAVEYLRGKIRMTVLVSGTDDEIDQVNPFTAKYYSYLQAIRDRSLEREGDIKARIFDSVALFSADILTLDVSNSDVNTFVGYMEKFGTDMAGEEYADAVTNLTSMMSAFPALSAAQQFTLEIYMKRAFALGKGMLFVEGVDAEVLSDYSSLACTYKTLVVVNIAEEAASEVISDVLSSVYTIAEKNSLDAALVVDDNQMLSLYKSVRTNLLIVLNAYSQTTTDSRVFLCYIYLFRALRNLLCGYYTNAINMFYLVIKSAVQITYKAGYPSDLFDIIGQVRSMLFSYMDNRGMIDSYLDLINPVQESYMAFRVATAALPQERDETEATDILSTFPTDLPVNIEDIAALLDDALDQYDIYVDSTEYSSTYGNATEGLKKLVTLLKKGVKSVTYFQAQDYTNAYEQCKEALFDSQGLNTLEGGAQYFWLAVERLMPLYVLVSEQLVIQNDPTVIGAQSSQGRINTMDKYLRDAFFIRFKTGESMDAQFIDEDAGDGPEAWSDQDFIDTLDDLVTAISGYMDQAVELSATSQVVDVFDVLDRVVYQMGRRAYFIAFEVLSALLQKINSDIIALVGFSNLWSAITEVYNRFVAMKDADAFPDNIVLPSGEEGVKDITLYRLSNSMISPLTYEYTRVKDLISGD